MCNVCASSRSGRVNLIKAILSPSLGEVSGVNPMGTFEQVLLTCTGSEVLVLAGWIVV